MKKVLMLCFFAVCALSCNKTETIYAESSLKESHVIPIEDAMNGLRQFLGGNSLCETKTVSEYDIITLFPKSVLTKASESSPLLYIVNFKDENGFAVLSADDRISTDVIAVSENGTLNEQEFHKLKKRTLYNGFSLDGPGVSYNQDSSEVVVNPNTFEPYNEEYDDYYVGDLFVENPADTLKKFDPKPFLAGLIENYALNEVASNNWTRFDTTRNHIFDDGRRTIVTYETSYEDRVSPMFAGFDNWHQYEPFNYFSPERKKEKAPCGCVDLATAYVMTYWGFPDNFYINGVKVEWKNIRKMVKYRNYKPKEDVRDTISDFLSISTLTRDIGMDCLSIYSAQGTFTFPSLAARYLSDCAYPNVKYQRYNEAVVRSSMMNGCPIIICSIPGLKLEEAHAWNIDGFKDRITTAVIKEYKNDVLKSVTREVSEEKMIVHCNFGWNGLFNGYYVSGIFALKDGEWDTRGNDDDKTKYNNYLKIITYDSPR